MFIPWFRIGATVAVLVAFVAFVKTRDAAIEQRGAARVTSELAKKTDKINAKTAKARSAARTPGAVDRVRNKWCRDC